MEEEIVEINREAVKELAEGVLDYLETQQDKYSAMEMVYAIITIYKGMVLTMQDSPGGRVKYSHRD